LHSDPHDATARFKERLGERLLGVGLGLAHAFRVALPQPAERRLSRPLVAQRSSAVEAGADPYAELGCPGRAGAKAACWLRQKTSTAAMKQASAMGPNGGYGRRS
jgi:hypothetical protein